MKKFRTFAVTAVLLISQLALSQEVASAVTGTFNCGTSGTYTVIDGVLQGSNTCTGAMVLDSSVSTIGYATSFGSPSPGITSITIPSTTTLISYFPILQSQKNLVDFDVSLDNPNYSDVDGVLYNKNQTQLIAYPHGKSGTTFTVPDSVTSINYYAFNCLKNLQTLTIGVNLISMDYAFSFNACDSTSLQDIDVAAGNPNYSDIDGVFFDKLQTNLLQYLQGRTSTSYVVPSTVTTITRIDENPYLTAISLPTGLTTISTYAFRFSKLTSVVIPDSVVNFGSYPFYGSGSLQSISVNSSASTALKSIDGVLYSKNGKTLIEYPDGRTNTSFVIPSEVETVLTQWVSRNNFLLKVTVPASVTSLGSGYLNNRTVEGSYIIFQGNTSLIDIAGDYAKTIIYCGTASSVVSNWATAQSKTVSCQTEAPDFALSSSTLSGIKSTGITGYTISSSIAADYFSISPSLSSGLTFSTTTGLISGTPSVTAPATNYTVTGYNGIGSTSKSFALTVNAAPAFTLSPTTLIKSVGTTSSFYAISSTGGTIASYSISPDISNTPGLSFSTSTGLFSGTPTQAATARIYTITATNSISSTSKTFTLTINAAPAFTLSTSSQTKTVGLATSFYTISSTGGAITSYSMSPDISNTPGLSFSTSTGLISGIPTQSGAGRTYTITATNSVGSTTQTYSITVYTAEELAAQAAAQKAAEDLAAYQAAMEIRRLQIAAAKNVVLDLFRYSMPVSIIQFQDAMYDPVSPKVINQLNREILNLSYELRFLEKEINKLIYSLTFNQAFYDLNDRPTLDIYYRYGFHGMNSRILINVNQEILFIPSIQRTDLSLIKYIVLKYATVDQICDPTARKYITSNQLINIGLMPADYRYKTTILTSLKRSEIAQINTYQKIQKMISLQMAVIKARADRLAAIKQKIQRRTSD
jgi:hypothetical protein